MGFLFNKASKNEQFGSPYAVLNISKVGLRYFRICILASDKSKDRLLNYFINHPNVGWVFSAEGWFNIGIGIWAQSNSEINEISTAIRKELNPKDKIIYQSELTSLYGFGNRPIDKNTKVMTIVDSVMDSVDLTPLELDYLKLVALDSSAPSEEVCELLGIAEDRLTELNQKLFKEGIIVGYQNRVNYGGFYYKVFIDSLSRKEDRALENLLESLWNDQNCIYIERANGKYDVEFEVVLEKKSDIKKYLVNFTDYQTVILTKNLYTNLYPLNKIANLKQIKDTLSSQSGKLIDFRNSKLWYLNHKGTEAYLNVYDNKKYFEIMEKSELDLFGGVIKHIKESDSSTKFNLIDVGSGNGLKGRIFIEKIGEENIKAYYPVDVQPIELATTLKAHAEGKYAKHPTMLDFENLSSRFPLKLLPGEKQIYIFLGGTYGNFKSEIINSYLKPVISDSSVIFLVTMPIVSESKTETEIIDSYADSKIEDVFFGPLFQLGFTKDDFETNKEKPELKAIVAIEDRRLVSSFILAKDKLISGRNFERGTVFKMTSSWKPTLNEFKKALETDFNVEKIFSNDSMAIALIKI